LPSRKPTRAAPIGAVERDAGKGHGGGGSDHRRDVGVHLGVAREHRRDDLHFIVEATREERTQRPVDQSAREDFLLRGTALALEEPPRDAARGVGLLLVVDGEREEILARFHVGAADAGDEDHGVIDGDEAGAIGLAGDFARSNVTW
jgi:hypothetical protein